MSEWQATLQRIADRNPYFSHQVDHILGSGEDYGYDDFDDGYDGYSSEMMAVRSGPVKGKLKNPRGSCTPHKQGKPRPGDGDCYQVHNQYGKANAGANGSAQRKKYMVNYRKENYKNRAEGAKKGLDSRKLVPRPFGLAHERTASMQTAAEREYLYLLSENARLVRIANQMMQKKTLG